MRGHWNGRWLIDFGVDRAESNVALYNAPFAWVETYVKPDRLKNREASRATNWWRAGRPRPEMRGAVANLDRILVTIETSRHRWFRWLSAEQAPEHKLVVIATDDEVVKGILESRMHLEWAKHRGNWLGVGNDSVYAAQSTFLTFPFPGFSEAQRAQISDAARTLDALRERWLNPPEWTRDEPLTFPATVGGPWHRHISGAETLTPGTVAEARYVRRVALPTHAAALKARTLTNLYNERPRWLADAHAALDRAVADAYGFSPNLTTPALLAALLDRNLAASA